MAYQRGSIAFATYRPPVPLDIFSCPIPSESEQKAKLMTDGRSYNYNGQVIPPSALKLIIKRPKLATEGFSEADVDEGLLSGLLFVSERGNLETLYIAFSYSSRTPLVLSFADVYGTYNGVRLEDSGCIADEYLIYVTTKDRSVKRREPWTAVYKTHLSSAVTERITPPGEADLSPSASPSGKRIAVASFEGKPDGWDGNIEDLNTNIFVVNVERPLDRKLVIKNGGWPSWGSEDVIFFHRMVCKQNEKGEMVKHNWCVFRADISDLNNPKIDVVTPMGIDAVTPAAINSTTVAVATTRHPHNFNPRTVDQFRHIEIFNTITKQATKVTNRYKSRTGHFNPFVIDGGKRIGFHSCRIENLETGYEIERQFNKVESPLNDVGLFKVSGAYPTISKDGTKIAFVDKMFRSLWLADDNGLRVVFESSENNIFSPVWNQNPKKNTLYVCMGSAFNKKKSVTICAILEASSGNQQRQQLTSDSYNSAFPSSNPEGTKLVYRSTKDWPEGKHTNLYIMEDARMGEYGESEVRRLTFEASTDTHCQWSPNGNWIVFSSTRDKPTNAPALDNGLDPGYFSIFLVKWDDPNVLVRVASSADGLAGHMNHPFFSPDGKSIVVTSDLAAVSADPVSLPLFVNSVRPYGDIFTIDIDPKDISKNEDVKNYDRITHSRYEYYTAVWSKFTTQAPNAKWSLQINKPYISACPYLCPDGGESHEMTGQLHLDKRCC